MKLVAGRKLRLLDFDLENRPLSYLGSDFTTADITAIAWSWVGSARVEVAALGEVDGEQMLLSFREAYLLADVVTGHYIRRHDLPIINGALMEHGLPGLSPKLVSDTKTDLRRRSGISASQESLADMLGVRAPKYHMSQARWRDANRLTESGIRETKKRVTMDVRQHKQLRARLVEQGLLKPPSVWRP